MSQPPYPQQPPHVPAPMSPSDERMWGMFGHLSAIAASFISLPFLGPLIIFLVFKDRSGFVRGHSAEALNMTISVIVYELALGLVLGLFTLVTFGAGFIFLWVAWIPPVVFLVFTILAAVAANRGEVYRYPLIFRLVR
ncbi:DUF4870 domain-containing protein [Kineococcus sp. TBRC 1896]|uniref:DUF4870 domain-containing protein n=1 Tax=Kineococcus mangrovi TaxID=1660183 RepID=A0ABV4I3B8_9ACTN